uniref:Uncharacterized protein n=1 Tax=Arundo donax TaxID=35708 RepID=A0A0A9H5T2_ARUDO
MLFTPVSASSSVRKIRQVPSGSFSCTSCFIKH